MSDPITLSLRDEDATRELAERIAQACQPGDVVLLRGPLGAGKTTFVDAFARALAAGPATSPTFVIAHRYPHGRIPLWHLDLYRLEEPGAVDELDLDQYIDSASVTLVEWPERAPNSWPGSSVEIELHIMEHGRLATIKGLESRRRPALASREPHA